MTLRDAVVLGLGIHGSASVYELVRRGLDVVGIDTFPARHERGSSHGATRMIRRAYPSPAWNEFVHHAYRGWDRWGRAAGAPFVQRTGGLFRAVRDPYAGVIAAARALAFAHDGALAAGAELRFGETVLGWERDNDSVIVRTDRGELRARRLVIAGGAWVARLVPQFAEFFEVWRIVTFTAPAGQQVAQPPALGCFSVDLPEGLVFGLPETPDAGAKIGIDAREVWDPDVPVAAPTSDESERLAGLLRRFVPGIVTTGGDAVACLYTMTPDKRFVLGALPGTPEVLIVAACSGHGFKFAPAVGEAVADLVEHIDRPDLALFDPARMGTT
jgi:glycine/D-amino acid oxidase-like deaminating enzyme